MSPILIHLIRGHQSLTQPFVFQTVMTLIVGLSSENSTFTRNSGTYFELWNHAWTHTLHHSSRGHSPVSLISDPDMSVGYSEGYSDTTQPYSKSRANVGINFDTCSTNTGGWQLEAY
ncbi:hypothetical protein VTL71DRAFT_13307 [Oculimacula yallundae]|uniref:Uncharacterized protein n=1 Tax=Oculimacula yallundae TaxID=86028 RepID=A0ABR4CLG5_9HELO